VKDVQTFKNYNYYISWFIKNTMDELENSFEQRGKQRILERSLNYFRDELRNPGLQLHSIVFPHKLDRYDIITCNRLVVKVFLAHVWACVMEAYPRTPKFVNVIARADVMYTTQYPFVDVKTQEARGIETVQDFFDFAWNLIIKLHVPCLNTVGERCNNREGAAPRSSTGLIPFFDERLNAMENLNAPDNPWGQKVRQFESTLTRKYEGVLSVDKNKHLPQRAEFTTGEDTLKQLRNNNLVVTKATVWGIVQDMLKSEGISIHCTVNEENIKSPLTFAYSLQDGIVDNFDEAEIALITEALNTLVFKIEKDGDLSSMIGMMVADISSRMPLNFAVNGFLKEDGKFISSVIFYMATDKIRFIDGINVQRLLSPNPEQPLHVFIDLAVKFNMPNPGDVPVAIGQEISEAQLVEKSQDMIGRFLAITAPTQEQMTTSAMALVEAIFGEKWDPLSQREMISAVFLSAESSEKNPREFGETADMFASLLYTRDSMLGVKLSDRLELLLKQGDVIRDRRLERQSEHATDADGLHNEVLKMVSQLLADPVYTEIDRRAALIPGWEDFKAARDSADPVERMKAKTAVQDAVLMHQYNLYPTSYFARYVRWAQRTSSCIFPFGYFCPSVGDTTIDEEGDHPIFTNFEANIMRAEATQVEDMELGSVMTMVNDVSANVNQKKSRHLKEFGMHIHEQVLVFSTLMYFFIICVGDFLRKLMTHEKTAEDTKHINIASHVILLGIGLATHVPLAVVHAVLLVSIYFLTGAVIGFGKSVEVFAKTLSGLFKEVISKCFAIFRNGPDEYVPQQSAEEMLKEMDDLAREKKSPIKTHVRRRRSNDPANLAADQANTTRSGRVYGSYCLR
jgi:hypothetical protein